MNNKIHYTSHVLSTMKPTTMIMKSTEMAVLTAPAAKARSERG